MGSQLSTQERTVLVLAGVFAIVFSGVFMTFQKPFAKTSQSEALKINYEMAKAKSVKSDFSLDGRDVERSAIELEENATNPTSAFVKSAKASKVAKTAKDSKSVKKEVAKKAENKAQTANDRKQNRLKTDKKYEVTGKAELTPADTKDALAQQVRAQNYYQNPQPSASNEVPQDNDLKNVKTIDQWKKEIFASKSREDIVKFISAYRKNEVTESDYYTLVNEMLKSDDEVLKGYGLFALRATPSYMSFAQLSQLPALSESLQTYANQSLLAYNQPQNLTILKTILSSKSKVLVLSALNVLKSGYQEVQSGTGGELVDARYRRDPNYQSFSLKNYLQFLPVLQKLQADAQQSGEQQIYTLASQLSQSIQSTAVVAAN